MKSTFHILLLLPVMLFTSCTPTNTAQDHPSGQPGKDPAGIRVVIQDPGLGTVMDVRDGFALVLSGRHVIELHEIDQPRLLHVLTLPDPIAGAAVDMAENRVFTSCNSGLIEHNLVSGERTMLSADTTGNLALDADARRLAVFGNVKQESRSRRAGGSVGVWDLRENRWVVRKATPLSTFHSPTSAQRPFWRENEVLLEGFDRGAAAKIPMGHWWAVSLDADAGEIKIEQGPPNEGQVPERMFPAIAEHEEYMKRVGEELLTHWENKVGTGRLAGNSLMAFAETDGKDVFIPVSARRGPTEVRVLRIGADGRIGFENEHPTRLYHETPWAVAGRLLIRGWVERQPHVYDLARREPLGPAPRTTAGRLPRLIYFSHGWMIECEDWLQYFTQESSEPRWKVEAKRERHFSRPVISGDGSLIVLLAETEDGLKLDVRQTEDGETVVRIEVDNSVRAVGFSSDSQTLAVACEKNLAVYDIPGGEKQGEAEQSMRFPPNRIIGVENGFWVLTNYGGAVILDESLEYLCTPAAGRVLDAFPVADDGMLLIGEHGDLTHIDLPSGKTPRRWHPVRGPGGPTLLHGPAQAARIRAGHLLIRNTGYAGTVELMSLPELKTIAYVRAVPIGENGLGWVAWTSDGYWNASPGAGHFVEIMRGLETLSAEEKEKSRTPEVIQL